VRVKLELGALFAIFLLSATTAWADRAVVLVVSTDSPIETLSALDVRKAYLGIAVRHGGQEIRALRLSNDPELDEIFLQSVVAMSEKSYTYRLLSNALRYGRPRPPEVRDLEALLNALSTNPYSIACVWQSDADRFPELEILRVLWQDY